MCNIMMKYYLIELRELDPQNDCQLLGQNFDQLRHYCPKF